jgi:FPC/CPF motif-containing protein YcgG
MPVVVGDGVTPQPWWDEVTGAFAAEVGQRGYPCHFGRQALQRGELHVTFFERDPGPLVAALRDFLDLSRPHLARRMVLAAFRRPEAVRRDERWYADEFWRILQYLHDHDDRPWPADASADPEDPGWEFSFHGTAMFVFSAAPSYEERRSRRLGPGMVLLFQPRNVFDGIEGGTPKGIQARQLIRKRMLVWDTQPPHADLGDYGNPSNHEWRQYFIADGDSRLHERCPLHANRPVTR